MGETPPNPRMPIWERLAWLVLGLMVVSAVIFGVFFIVVELMFEHD